MSISKMDWSRRNANGAVAHPNNQQYLPQSTSSTVQTMPSHKTPNTYSPTQTFSTNSVSHNHILKSLLGASSIEEIAKIQLSALSNTTGQQSLQISQAQYNALFSSQQKMTTATNQQNSHGGQNPVISNYQLQIYPDSVLQNFQQTQLGQQLVVQQQTQPMHFLQQIIQQQAQPMQQARPKPNVQQQTLPMLQPKPNVQQQTQPMQQPMPNVQQQTQPMQQPMPIVQQQTQPMQQARHMSIVQQPQVMPFVQQQAQTMQLPFVQQQAQTMQQPVAQQQAQPMQQPQSMPVVQQQAQPGQCYNIRINNGEIQQAPQSTQSGGYSHKNSQKAMKTYSRKRYSQNVQTSYQSMPQPNGQTIYSSPNGNSVQYVASYKANVPVSTSNYQNGQNVPVSTSNYQNGQNVPVSTSNYQNGQNVPVSTSNYQNGQNVPVSTSDCQNGQNVPVSTSNYQNGQNIQNQMGSNFQTNTLQLQRDVNDYIQSPQRQVMPSLHSGFANNSSNVLPSATVGQMPPLYSQSTTNASNVCNVSVNQRLPNPSQNVGAQNVQQPEQSYSAPQDPHSVSVPPPANFGNVPQDPRSNVQNILALLKVYRNVKLKYLMLNRENNLLRQKMLSSPQDNSGPVKPPLISILSESTVPSNNPIGGKEVSPNSTVQSRPPSNTHGVQTPPLYNDHLNVPVQNIDQSSNSFSSHGHSANSDLLNQRNNTGQMNLGSNANSSGQAVGSGTLRDQGHQEISMGSVQANKQYFSQDGLHVTSIQSVDQTTKSSESCNPVHAASASNFYSNKPLTFSSREAIKATLPLWKSVSQCSTQSEYSEPKQPTVDGLNAIQILEEMASHPINESSAVTLTQKSEHSGPNASKGVEPQIAIVSPLVQIKDLANDIRRHSKVVQQGEDLANNGVSGVKGNDQFNKLLQSLESDDARLRSSMVFSSPCSIEVSSNCNVDQTSAKNIETDDDSLQISGVCTLVEGNSSYDSSIALMFEGSLQTRTGTPMAKTDLNDEHTLQCSQEDINIGDSLQAASSFSPSTEVIAVKSEPEEEIEPQVNIEDDLQGENVCLQAQPENNLPAADVFDLESDTVSDQLSELLTEFPFGIKNYMSEEKSTEVSLRKYTAKTEFPKTSMSFSFDGESESIEDMQIENAMDTLTKEIEPSRTEDTDQQCMVERAPIDEGNSTQLDDDCFEVCDSPEDNIHITLLDQDQINKLFPEDSTEPIVNSEESLVKSCEKDSEAPVVDNTVNAIKEKSETVSVAHKELFCCLFSWLTHTNGNAPKCNCKLAELSETRDLTSSFLEPVAMIKTEPSADVDEPFREDLDSPTNGLKPSFSDPCKTKLDEIKNAEILPPVLKRPKLEPIECPIESKTDQDIVNPQKGIQANEYLPEKKNHEDQSLKDLRTYYTLTNEKVIQSKSLFEDPMSMESNDPFVHSDSKDDGPPKLEKLIIKTDFLKNKHLSKMKKKYKERKMSRVEEGGSRNVSKNYESTEMFESAKTYYIDRSAKVGNEKFNPLASTVQQPEKGMSKLKSSSSSDKSHSHSQAPSLDKRRGRRKKQPESHFEKVKNVPTVQEYLERKRELCNKRPVSKVDEREETPEVRHRVVEKHSMEKTGNDLLMKLLTNQPKRGRPKNIGGSQPLFKKHSHEKGSLVNKGSDQKSTFYRDKIYLSPCDVSRLASCEGINLTKLQIRRSPEKPAYDERRKSLESYVPNEQKKEAPKMLEFKLCPEFDHRNPTTQERKGEPKPVTEKSIVEGIKSKKEAWCSGGPGRKSWIDGSSEEQGNHPSESTSSIQSSSQKSSSRTVQDSKATFNAFKQLYHEQRSKSLDHSL